MNRPLCEHCKKNEGWVSLFGKWFCGDCVTKWYKKKEAEGLKSMLEDLDGS